MNYKKILIIILVVFVVIILLYYIENRLLFWPIKLNPNHSFNLELYRSKDIKVREKTIRTKDNIKINLVHFDNHNSKHLFIYAHGNGGNISNSLEFCRYLVNLGSVITFDYRGYGKSEGTPTEQGVYNDILAVWNYAINKLGYEPSNIVLYGHSLGSSVVAWLGHFLCQRSQLYEVSNSFILIGDQLSKHKKGTPKLIVMQAGFSSLQKIALELYPKFLLYLMRNNFNSEHYVKTIGNLINIMVLHSYGDEMIGIHHKDNLIKANDKISFYPIKGDHNNPKLDNKIIYQIISAI